MSDSVASERFEAFVTGIIGGAGAVLSIISFLLSGVVRKFPFVFGDFGDTLLSATVIGAAVTILTVAYEVFRQGKLRG